MNGPAVQPAWMPREAGGARPHGAQRVIAVAWRHPALIVACALAGAVATAALSRPGAAAAPAVAHVHMQPILPSPDLVAAAPMLPGSGGPGLRLDLELGDELAAAPGGVLSQEGDAGVADAGGVDDIDALLRQSPPAAGPPGSRTLDGAAPPAGRRAIGMLPGVLAGLLLGLLAAAARELRGDRMRSAREAEWALGAPVLGAIPTLSARTRGTLVAPASRRGGAEPG